VFSTGKRTDPSGQPDKRNSGDLKGKSGREREAILGKKEKIVGILCTY
jgi:hypothetical protein